MKSKSRSILRQNNKVSKLRHLKNYEHLGCGSQVDQGCYMLHKVHSLEKGQRPSFAHSINVSFKERIMTRFFREKVMSMWHNISLRVSQQSLGPSKNLKIIENILGNFKNNTYENEALAFYMKDIIVCLNYFAVIMSNTERDVKKAMSIT